MAMLRAYLIDATYEWLIDNGYNPVLYVNTKHTNVKVPKGYAVDDLITLDLSNDSIENYVYDDKGISFTAIFDGIDHDIYIPFEAVVEIYAKGYDYGLHESLYDIDGYKYKLSIYEDELCDNENDDKSSPYLKIVKK